MRNIHVLPTENSSRLSYNKDGVLELHKLQWRKNTQHIYITNGEEIKEGDYILIHGHYKHGKHITKVVKITDTYEVIEGGNHSKKACQRIILTTDQDLIKNGVQPIDDEFLEWFVKNPSCEFVEVDKNWNYPLDKSWEYKLRIIPKEEPKQEETLEESAEKFYPGVDRQIDRMLFINGAKWQQEQDKKLYSEEDLDMLRKFMIQEQNFSKSCLDVFIEQFKNKK